MVGKDSGTITGDINDIFQLSIFEKLRKWAKIFVDKRDNLLGVDNFLPVVSH